MKDVEVLLSGPLLVLIILAVIASKADITVPTWLSGTDTPIGVETLVEPGRHQVDSVTDGDSIRVVGVDQAIRLIGIDAPEATSFRFGQPECLGTEATAQLQALLPPGTTIEVELGQETTDRYDRALAYVYAGDVLINEAMVHSGMAYAVEYPPNTRFNLELEAAQADAQAAGAGVWGFCSSEDRDR